MLPLNQAVSTRPVFSLVRIFFHAGLLALAVFYSGHIAEWEMSQLELSWVSLPDDWSDTLTLLLLALCVFFLIRRLVKSELRRISRFSDWLVIGLAGLPLLTGYLLVHGEGLPGFIEDNLYTVHLLTGELMLIGTGFLFIGVRLTPQACVGCAACELNCPANALQVHESAQARSFNHNAQSCLICGQCFAQCPEKAISYHHIFSWQALLGGYSKQKAGEAPLVRCTGCEEVLGTAGQLTANSRLTGKGDPSLCPQCLRKEQVSIIHSPQLPEPQTPREVAHESDTRDLQENA